MINASSIYIVVLLLLLFLFVCLFVFLSKDCLYYFCRLYLAAMHSNENAEQEQARTAEGKPIYRLTFAKSRKGKATAKPVKTEPTFSKLSKQ